MMTCEWYGAYQGVDSNRKIAARVLEGLLSAKSGKLSLLELEENILANLRAVDSTFPKDVVFILDGLVPKVLQTRLHNGAVVLNTPRERDYDENDGVDALFDEAIDALLVYLK